jgi:hypothetical protein
MFHYNQISTDSVKITDETSPTFYVHRCLLKRHEKPGNLLKLGWVRPEDLHFYSDIGIHYFKLQGRDNVDKGDPVRAVEAYCQESFQGNLMQLLDLFDSSIHLKTFIDNKKLQGFLTPFYENDYFCKNDCAHCNYCESFAKKCVDVKKTREVYHYARKFYSEYDRFKRMLTSVNSEPVQETQADEITADFNID